MRLVNSLLGICTVIGFFGCSSGKGGESDGNTTPEGDNRVETPQSRNEISTDSETPKVALTQVVVQKDGAEGLKAHFLKLQEYIAKKDIKMAASMTRALLPDAGTLKKIFKTTTPADKIKQILAMYTYFLKGDDSKIARLIKVRSGQTDIQVYSATTEEIAENIKDSVVWMYFAGGAVKAANNLFKPGLTFYELKCVKPGEKSGMKYHLFFYDGKKWSMLGPIWRAFRRKY